MEALLTAIVVWLSANYSLPASFEHPRVEFVSAIKLTSLSHRDISQQQQAGILLNQSGSEIVSLYIDNQPTIYLLDGWTGKTPLSYPFWSTKWSTTFKTSDDSNLTVPKRVKSLHIRRKNTGSACSDVICRATSRWTPSQSS